MTTASSPRLPIASALALLIACCLAAAPAGAGGDSYRAVDEANGLTLTLGPAWRAIVPDPEVGRGAMTLMNYDQASIPKAGGQESNFPPGTVKLDIRTTPREHAEDLDGWKIRQFHALSAAEGLTVGRALETKIAARDAVAYVLSTDSMPATLAIDLLWDDERVVNVSILPVTSEALGDALAVVDRLRSSRSSLGAAADDLRHPDHGGSKARLLEAFRPLLEDLPLSVPTKVATCPPGTFDGAEAPLLPVTLSMPFRAEAGFYWQAGNFGSFYGNGAHCNGNADYYAIDWNRYSNAGCTIDAGDAGQPVYPVYAGTVVAAGWDSTGYGYKVEVQHLINGTYYRSRYAHLQVNSIAVSVGDAVSTSTQLGAVGSTGNSNGAHLHMSFQQYTNGAYQSRCYNGGQTCPNGEAPWWPQTVKPSPMATHLGNVNIQDYGCYAVTATGGGGGTTIQVDDSQSATIFHGPSQYWWQVWGYGQSSQMHYTWNSQYTEGNYVYWTFNIPTAGDYRIDVYIPSNHATTTRAQYYLWNGSQWSFLTSVNQNSHYNAWVPLSSSVYLSPGLRWVKLTDVTLEPSGTRKVGIDAIRVIKN